MTKRKMGMVLGTALLATALAVPVMALENEDVVGTWYLNIMEMEGTEINPGSMGMEMTIEFAEDGTALVLMTDEEDTPAEWVIEGDVLKLTDTANDTTMDFTLAEDNLTTDEDGTIMTFGREKVEAEVYEPGTVIAEPALTDFDGSWKATLVDVFGMQMPVELAECEVSLELKDGNGTLYYNDGLSEVNGEMEGTLDGDVLTLVNKTASEDAVNLYFSTDTMTLRLHDDGMMSYSNMDFSGEEAAAEETAETEEAEEAAEETTDAAEETEEEEDSFAVYFEKQ